MIVHSPYPVTYRGYRITLVEGMYDIAFKGMHITWENSLAYAKARVDQYQTAP